VVDEARSGGSYGAYAQSRFANIDAYGSHVETPGWKRAQSRAAAAPAQASRAPKTIEGEVLSRTNSAGKFAPGARIFHVKFGPGSVAAVDGAKLTIDFDKAGRKLVLDSFVELRG
jgi:DNA helicase-2/ATP-dependent DNA helicase PcrA